MLKLIVQGGENYNDATHEFTSIPDSVLELEHSLVSLSKWESIWEKPFLSESEKSTEEVLSYIQCMTLGDDISPEVYLRLSDDHYSQIDNYINAKMTATWFTEATKSSGSSEAVTAEIIYYWMIALSIPMSCETWHLSKLLALVKVCNAKNAKPEKVPPAQAAAERKRLNAKRKAETGTRG